MSKYDAHATDRYWKTFRLKGDWYSFTDFTEKMSRQRPSYSDSKVREVDYGH